MIVIVVETKVQIHSKIDPKATTSLASGIDLSENIIVGDKVRILSYMNGPERSCIEIHIFVVLMGYLVHEKPDTTLSGIMCACVGVANVNYISNNFMTEGFPSYILN